jgi:hypothetical protein
VNHHYSFGNFDTNLFQHFTFKKKKLKIKEKNPTSQPLPKISTKPLPKPELPIPKKEKRVISYGLYGADPKVQSTYSSYHMLWTYLFTSPTISI